MRFTEKRIIEGKCFSQIEYDDGYRGGWFEEGSPLPGPDVQTDPTTVVFCESKLFGKMDVVNSQIKATIICPIGENVVSSRISNSEIIDSKICNSDNTINIVGAKLFNCSIEDVNVTIEDTEAKGLAIFDEEENFESSVSILNSEISNLIIATEEASNLWAKKVKVSGDRTKIQLQGHNVIDIKETDFISEKNCAILAESASLDICGCKFLKDAVVNASGTVKLANSVLKGVLNLESGSIENSILNGFFSSASSANIDNCYFGKNNVVKIESESIDRVAIRSSRFTGNSKVVCDSDAVCSYIEIGNVTAHKNSSIVVENGPLRIADSKLSDECLVCDSEVICTTVSGSARINSVNIKESFVEGTARIGYMINGEKCENGIRSNINEITVDSVDDFAMLDVSDQEIVSFDRKNGVSFYSGKNCEVLHVDVEQDVESFEEFAKNKNVLPIGFDTFSYFRKISDEIAEISERKISELVNLFLLFVYANELHDIYCQAADRSAMSHFDLFEEASYPYYEFPAYQPIGAIELFKIKDEHPICDTIKKMAVLDIRNNSIVGVRKKIIPNIVFEIIKYYDSNDFVVV